jgi:hypothetical protein
VSSAGSFEPLPRDHPAALSPSEEMLCLQQLLNAIAFSFGKGVIRCDLKSQTVLVHDYALEEEKLESALGMGKQARDDAEPKSSPPAAASFVQASLSSSSSSSKKFPLYAFLLSDFGSARAFSAGVQEPVGDEC